MSHPQWFNCPAYNCISIKYFILKNNDRPFHENKNTPHPKSSQLFLMPKSGHFTVTWQFIRTNIFRTSFSPHFKHCSYIHTYRHFTTNTIVLNVHVLVFFSSTSIISSVAPASHLIHLAVRAPRLIVVWAYLDLYFKHIIKPRAEYTFWDYLITVSQLQALCNVQQWDAEMARSGLKYGPITDGLNLVGNSVDGP